MEKLSIQFERQAFTLNAHGGDVLSERIKKHGTFYEVDLLRAIRKAHAPGTMIYDVGANIGNHTVFFGKVMGQRVRAFEPFPASQEILAANVTGNGLAELVSIERVGLSNGHGQATTSIGIANNMGTVSVKKVESGPVELRPLDFYAEVDDRIGTIKIDVEGHEMEVLNGAIRTIMRDRPELFIECSTDQEFQTVSGFLAKYNYAVEGRYCATPTYHYSPAA
jgi:FkbM family methyltransferase